MRRLIFKAAYLHALFMAMTLVGCGTYRTGSGSYNGMGTFRPPSDYSENAGDGAQISEEDSSGARHKLNQRSQYVPRYAFKLYWPVSQVRINRGFNPPSDRAHSGIDLGGKRGTPILAAHEGVVIYVGHDFKGYGKMLLVEYDGEWATLYGHLDEFSVSENTIVNPGDQLGTMGSTGHATGVHLHFELMHNHLPMDPMTMLSKPSNFTSLKNKRRQTSELGRRKHAL